MRSAAAAGARLHGHPRPAVRAAVERLGPVVAAAGDQRLPERQVEVDGPVERRRVGAAGERAPVRDLPGHRLRDADLGEQPHGGAEQAELVDRLVGAGAAQLRRPVGGEDEQRRRARRPPRARPGGSPPPPSRTCTGPARGRPDAFARPERQERRGPLVDADVQPDPRVAACNASASGADRDPGASTASVTPQRASSSTSTRASAVDGFTASPAPRSTSASRSPSAPGRRRRTTAAHASGSGAAGGPGR